MTTNPKTTTIELAVLTPANAIDEITEAIAEIERIEKDTSKAAIDQKHKPASPTEMTSGFDPVTVGGFIWVAVKVAAPVVGKAAGKVAASIALKIVTEAVWSKLKSTNKSTSVELPIRFRSGEKLILKSDSAEDITRLREILEKHELDS